MLWLRLKGQAYLSLSRRLFWAVDNSFSNPRLSQWRRLSFILRRNSRTLFGREHDFAACRSMDDYRERVPVADYSAFQPLIERAMAGEKGVLSAEDPFFFLTTSGTSGPVKYIPLTQTFEMEMVAAQRYWDSLLLKSKPYVLAGRPMILGSAPIEGRTASGIPCGALSGKYLLPVQGFWGNLTHKILLKNLIVPWQAFQIKDLFARSYVVALLALAQEIGNINSVNPSSLIQLFQFITDNRQGLTADIERGRIAPAVAAMLEESERRAVWPYLAARLAGKKARAKLLEGAWQDMPFSLSRVWPTLARIGCWLGGPLSFYIDHLRKFSGSIPLRDIGYRASEGFFAIPRDDETAAGALNVYGHFLEFSREEDSRGNTLLADELRTGERYNLIVTQSGGLYRYDMDDVVEVIGRYKQTPLIRFCHKGSGTLNLTGEKITEIQAANVMERFCRRWQTGDVRYCLAHQKEIPPYYIFIVEEFLGIAAIEKETALPGYLDGLLQEMNHEYKGKRGSGRLAPLRVWVVASGSFADFVGLFRPALDRTAQSKFAAISGMDAERDWFRARLLRELR